MPADPEDALEYSARIDAPAETVFNHFTDPELITRWLGRRALLDPRPGGAWSVDVNGRDIVAGTYIAVEPYTRLAFSWSWRTADTAPEFESVVEVRFVEEDGATIVTLRHSGLPGELRTGHDEGWRHYLDRLVIAASGGDPGRDPLGTAATRHNQLRPGT